MFIRMKIENPTHGEVFISFKAFFRFLVSTLPCTPDRSFFRLNAYPSCRAGFSPGGILTHGLPVVQVQDADGAPAFEQQRFAFAEAFGQIVGSRFGGLCPARLGHQRGVGFQQQRGVMRSALPGCKEGAFQV